MNPPTSPPPPFVRPIVVVPLSTPHASIEALCHGGYVPVFCDTPDAVRVVMTAEQIASTDLCMAALHAVANCGYTAAADKFVQELWRRLKANEAAHNQPSKRA
jgi:dTDP-4-amino-4,6-dideoxygalactose transaminase